MDVFLSGRKRISGSKYSENTKTQSRQWTHKKYTSRLEMLRQEIKFLEDDGVRDYFMSEESESKIKEKCYAYQTYKKMAEEVIKPPQETSSKKPKYEPKHSKMRRHQRSLRSAKKRGHFEDY